MGGNLPIAVRGGKAQRFDRQGELGQKKAENFTLETCIAQRIATQMCIIDRIGPAARSAPGADR